MGFDIKGLLLILAIVVVLFGTKRLRNMGGDLGSAIKGFRSAMNQDDNDKDDDADDDDDPQVLEHNRETHSNTAPDSERSVNKTEDQR